jgi:predicted GNAT family acetyltransferase
MSERGLTIEVADNPAASRFEAQVDGDLAVAEYERSGNTVTFTHTLVPEALRKRGIGTALARAALEKAREEGWRVVPRCPFIAAFVARHPQYHHLLPNET